MARNMIRRALFEIVDPYPSAAEKRRVWEHFAFACAYCGLPLVPGKKQAHLDHLIPSSAGGRNHISNRVLSCALCNEHEKREMEWETFLRIKAGSERDWEERRTRIQAWIGRFPPEATVLAPELRVAADRCADEAATVFSEQAAHLRSIRDATRP